MNFQDLQNTIALCDGGQINFQRAYLYALLFRKKWYPLRAVVNNACGDFNLTKDQCLRELGFLLKYVRLDQVQFNDCLPVALTSQEILEEIRLLTKGIDGLVD